MSRYGLALGLHQRPGTESTNTSSKEVQVFRRGRTSAIVFDRSVCGLLLVQAWMMLKLALAQGRYVAKASGVVDDSHMLEVDAS
jgi:hypothetical protein